MKTEFHTKNFALHEFTNSTKANELAICNEVTTIEQLTAIANLTANVLQPARDIVGFPMTITSGFRCDELNEEVGGVDNSINLHFSYILTNDIKWHKVALLY